MFNYQKIIIIEMEIGSDMALDPLAGGIALRNRKYRLKTYRQCFGTRSCAPPAAWRTTTAHSPLQH